MRDGEAQQIAPKIDLPFSIHVPHTYRVPSLDSGPDNRLVMLTDDMLERNANDSQSRACPHRGVPRCQPRSRRTLARSNPPT